MFSSAHYVELVPAQNPDKAILVLQNAFKLHFAQQLPSFPDQALFKQLYCTTGMAFIYVRPATNPLELRIKRKVFEESNIFALNHLIGQADETSREVKAGSCELLIFRCLWSKKENIVFEYDPRAKGEKVMFPPLGGIRVLQRRGN